MACTAEIVGPTGKPSGTTPVTQLTPDSPIVPFDPTAPFAYEGVGPSGMRRLSRSEYVHSVYDLLGIELNEAGTALPDDSGAFGNDYLPQLASETLIESAQQLAELAAERVVADAAKRDALVGCKPMKPDDAACMRSFVERLARRAFRQPPSKEDVDALLALDMYARDAQDFYAGVQVVIRAVLQHPAFLYRIELGAPVAGHAGVYALSPHELAARLAYFLTASTPDALLLAAADADALHTRDEILAQATRLLESARGHAQVQKFHAVWLGTGAPQAPSAELFSAMRAESTALIERVIFDRKDSWGELFRSQETFANDALATHYGLAPTGSTQAQWVSYGTSGRKGILSHASFLSNGIKFGDTSPTQRGKLIRTRLLCQPVPPPPPNVNADEPPSMGPGSCKSDYYKLHSTSAVCASCHQQMDPLGFGLENYDGMGRFRTTEPANAACTISGEGELVGVGTFKGPAELGELLLQSGLLEPCAAREAYHLAIGRLPGIADKETVAAVTQRFQTHHRFDQLLLDIVSHPGFAHRREE